ncbi:MAG: PQQ-dependent sugar dehydrogenase [Acidobacteriota bacterium]
MRLLPPVLLFLLATTVRADVLPGFRVETVAPLPGFVSSVVVDSHGTVYATTTDGWIHRVQGNQSVPVAAVPTKAGGNGGLLGMALLDDVTAVVHYTTWSGTRVLDDVISSVDLITGAEHVLKAFPCDIEFRERGVSDEHHGGNLTVAPDGSIFVGIGEYGGHVIAQRPEWNGGKIWRLDRDGNATQFARGMRNPYDLAWDPAQQRLIVADNGPTDGDEINVVEPGDNCGWPETYGANTPLAGFNTPVYVFPHTVAPTGVVRLAGANPILPRGLLVGAFVSRALYHFPDMASRPVAPPAAIVEGLDEFIIDVTEGADGRIYFAAAGFAGSSTIRELITPPRGDCNGDGRTDSRDIIPTLREIDDGDGQSTYTAQDGAYAGSWGCDANADGLIDRSDLETLVRMIASRRRTVRS